MAKFKIKVGDKIKYKNNEYEVLCLVKDKIGICIDPKCNTNIKLIDKDDIYDNKQRFIELMEKEKDRRYNTLRDMEKEIEDKVLNIEKEKRSIYKLEHTIALESNPHKKGCFDGCVFLKEEGFFMYCKNEIIYEMTEEELGIHDMKEYLGNSFDVNRYIQKIGKCVCAYYMQKE